MKIAEAVIALVVVLGVPAGAVVWAARRAVLRRAAERDARELREAPWRPREHSDGELLHFTCVRPGDEDVAVGYVAVNAPDFEEQVIGLREAQDDKLRTLNDRRH